MESKFQTSFIPKKTLDDTGKVKVKTPFNLLFIFSMIVILIALAASAGIFGFSYYLDKQIEAKSAELAQREREFPYAEVEEVSRVDNKLQATTKLLESHTALTPFFNILEENTLKNLRFDTFKFTYFSPTRVSLSMTGQARTFEAVARQAELFESGKIKQYIKEPVFSDLNNEEGGGVTFSFLATIDPSLINYADYLSGGTVVSGRTTASSTPASTATTTNRINVTVTGSSTPRTNPSAPNATPR